MNKYKTARAAVCNRNWVAAQGDRGAQKAVAGGSYVYMCSCIDKYWTEKF